MPSNANINDFLGKIDELRAVFILGQRAVPFLDELCLFLQEMVPLLNEIDTSLRESAQSMPQATSRLQSVSEATELATTEVLDLIDAASNAIGRVQKQTTEDVGNVDALYSTDARILRILRQELAEANPVLLERVEALLNEKVEIHRSLDHRLQEQSDALKEVQSALNRIMISQQVQDITTQQLAAVNHLIESVRSQMSTLLGRIGGERFTAEISTTLRAPVGATFDPNARYDTSGTRQRAADEVFGSGDGGSELASPAEPASQDDIDDLFDAQPAAGDGSAEPAEPASQDDIDQLFGASDVASQDDIDQLFGS